MCDLGHFGIQTCKKKARSSVYWPKINKQLEDMVSNCSKYLHFCNQQHPEPHLDHEIPEGLMFWWLIIFLTMLRCHDCVRRQHVSLIIWRKSFHVMVFRSWSFLIMDLNTLVFSLRNLQLNGILSLIYLVLTTQNRMACLKDLCRLLNALWRKRLRARRIRT